MTRLIIFLTLWLGCSLYAIVRGGGPERAGASIFLLAAVLSSLAESPAGSHFSSVEMGVLIVDLGVLAGFLFLAFAAERFWPLWMSAMQAIIVLSHLAVALNAEVMPWGYWNAETLWAYPMLLLLALATFRHQARLRLAPDPSWRRFFR